MNYKRIIDISMDLDEKTVVWIQDAQPKLIPIARQPQAPINFTWLDFGAHAGTHIDAPYYLYSDKWASHEVPFERLMGDVQVLDLTDIDDCIQVEHLQRHEITSDKILLKTKNSYDKMEKFNPEFVEMSPESAHYLIEKGVTTLGYDYQSFERDGKNVLHDIFLSKQITLIDNLRLKDTEEKHYYLICLPIKVIGIDAAPSRAILLEF